MDSRFGTAGGKRRCAVQGPAPAGHQGGYRTSEEAAGVQVFLTRPEELGGSEIAAWQGMQRATPALSSPYLSPEFAVAVGRLRPAARVAVLSDGHSITGFFPFERRRLGAGVPLCSWPAAPCGLIHAPGFDWDARELLRKCRLSAWQFDLLVAGQRPFAPHQTSTEPSFVMDLTDGFATYQAKLQAKSPRLCKELARKMRKLERDAGALRFVADSRDTRLLRTLMSWKSDQYRRTDNLDYFDHPWVVELIDTLLATRTDHVNGMLCATYAGDQPVAVQFGLRSRSVAAGWFTAYDARFAKYSPGMILAVQLAEALSAAGVCTLDIGKGASSYKETLQSHYSLVAEGIVAGRSALAAAHRAHRASARWAGRVVYQHPHLYHGTRRIRAAMR
jgi:CelD/BcsL family acetyltransferase involved in cellulose biosynthesis